MARVSNTAYWFSTLAKEPDRVGENTAQPGDLDGTNHARVIAQRGHGRQDELAIPFGCLQAVVTGAVEQEGINVEFRRPGKPVDQSVAG